MKKILTSVLILISSFVLKAQEVTRISGNVIDGNQKTIESATISLLKASDSSTTKFTVADKKGSFSFENVPFGKYLVSVSAIGHAKAFSNTIILSSENQKISLPAIELKQQSSSMSSVTVTGRKPFIEMRADKMVVNVDASVTNAGATALEVLEKSPGVTVDKDGNISLKGKQGVTVMLDGRPSYLSGTDLVNYLKSLPASAIDQIEIMTNPSAKYDAAGNSGIINIKSKKNKQAGFNGSVSAGYSQGIYWRTNNSINLNYKTGKFNFFANGGYNKNNNYHELLIQRKFKDSASGNINSIFRQTTQMINKNEFDNIKAGADYYVSKNTNIGFVGNAFNNPNEFLSNSTINLEDPNSNIDSNKNAKNDIKGLWKNESINLNFRHQFDSIGTEITSDLDYITYNSTSNQDLSTTSYDSYWVKNGLTQLQSNSPVKVNIYSAKVDFSHPMKHEAKIEAGVKSSFVNTSNEALYFNVNGSNETIDYTKTNNFDYNENIDAAYFNYSKHYKKFDAQLGLRYELTNMKGNEFGNPTRQDSSFKRSYSNLFPTAFITYSANKNNQFSLSFGRRIDRPDYESLNPFLFFLDQYTYEAGNPYINPQFTNNIELTHTFKGFLTTTLNYSHTKDFLTETFTQGQKSLGEDPSATIVSRGNLGSRDNGGASISAQVHVTKWWMSMLYGNYNYEKFNGNINNGTEKINVAAGNILFNVNNQFNFNKGWSAELSGFYRSKGVEGQVMIGSMGQVSGGVSKQVLKNKGSVRFNIRDIFKTNHPEGDINFGNTLAHFENINDSQVGTITFTYRFGKQIKDQQQRRKIGGADDEQNRVKVGNGN